MYGGEWARKKKRNCPFTISGRVRDDGTERLGHLLTWRCVWSPQFQGSTNITKTQPTPTPLSMPTPTQPLSTCTQHQPLRLLTWLLSWLSAWVAVVPCPPEAAPSHVKQQGTWVRTWQKPGMPNSPVSGTFQGTEPHGSWEGPWAGHAVLSGQQRTRCSQ